jgi:hypothetical protein
MNTNETNEVKPEVENNNNKKKGKVWKTLAAIALTAVIGIESVKQGAIEKKCEADLIRMISQRPAVVELYHQQEFELQRIAEYKGKAQYKESGKLEAKDQEFVSKLEQEVQKLDESIKSALEAEPELRNAKNNYDNCFGARFNKLISGKLPESQRTYVPHKYYSPVDYMRPGDTQETYKPSDFIKK